MDNENLELEVLRSSLLLHKNELQRLMKIWPDRMPRTVEDYYNDCQRCVCWLENRIVEIGEDHGSPDN